MTAPTQPAIFTAWPDGFQAMLTLESTMASSELSAELVELVKLRASQINNCDYCTQLHHDAALRAGVDVEMLQALDDPDRGIFGAAERAALALTEALTLLNGPPNAQVIAEARTHFTDLQLAQLLYVIATINAWNRLVIATAVLPA